MLADREVRPLNERGVDLPARGGQPPVDAGHGAEHHAVPRAHHPAAAIGLDHLGIEELGPRHPARFGHGTFGLLARGLHPLAEMRQESHRVVLEAVAKFDFGAKSQNWVSGIQWLTDANTLEKATLRQNRGARMAPPRSAELELAR